MRDEPMIHSFSAGKRAGTTILKLSGPLTISTMFGFQNELRTVKADVLIIDLSETPYIDSAGLGLIMNSHVSAMDRGGRLLLAGVNDRVKALFEMTKVNSVLKSFPSVAEAEASL
jgi:anti-anti-sigma factor